MAKEWGPCTWYLFHTLAEKMKPESFPIVKSDVVTMISRICANLPCPECAGHAQHKMGTLNVNHIRSKRDLQLIFTQFIFFYEVAHADATICKRIKPVDCTNNCTLY